LSNIFSPSVKVIPKPALRALLFLAYAASSLSFDCSVQ
jgi:hypothetical protein